MHKNTAQGFQNFKIFRKALPIYPTAKLALVLYNIDPVMETYHPFAGKKKIKIKVKKKKKINK